MSWIRTTRGTAALFCAVSGRWTKLAHQQHKSQDECRGRPTQRLIHCEEKASRKKSLRFGREAIICPNPAKLVDEYEVEEGNPLGAGIHGQVFRARHRRTGALRAIKKVPKADAAAIGAFVDEVRALIALDHQHIVKVIEYFFEGDHLFLVEEFCTGPDLLDYLLSSPYVRQLGAHHLDERSASIILRQCLKAIRCCHQQGFVHRDLKPDNFMLTGSDRTIRLIDFGFAQANPEIMMGQVGTYDYMAPELLDTGKCYGSAVDVWSLGVMLFVMLTGECFLAGEDEQKLTYLRSRDYIARRLQSKALAEVGASLEARDLLSRMLARDPDRRISAADALQHPFIESYACQYLEETVTPMLDDCGLDRLRRFSRFPRLKKIAFFTASHLASKSVSLGSDDLVSARRLFRAIDVHGTGVISLEDFRAALVKRGLAVPEDLQQVLKACNLDGLGSIHYSEFVACMLPDCLVSEDLYAEIFNAFDKGKTGRIEASNLQILCEAYGYDFRACEDMISEVSPAGRDHLDYKDFRIMMQDSPTSVE